MFLFSTVLIPALVLIQSPIQFVQKRISSGVKRSVRKAEHSTPSGAEVKNS
jgi:hypothetical protein